MLGSISEEEFAKQFEKEILDDYRHDGEQSYPTLTYYPLNSEFKWNDPHSSSTNDLEAMIDSLGRDNISLGSLPEIETKYYSSSEEEKEVTLSQVEMQVLSAVSKNDSLLTRITQEQFFNQNRNISFRSHIKNAVTKLKGLDFIEGWYKITTKGEHYLAQHNTHSQQNLAITPPPPSFSPYYTTSVQPILMMPYLPQASAFDTSNLPFYSFKPTGS